jgi:hypothetical protein
VALCRNVWWDREGAAFLESLVFGRDAGRVVPVWRARASGAVLAGVGAACDESLADGFEVEAGAA